MIEPSRTNDAYLRMNGSGRRSPSDRSGLTLIEVVITTSLLTLLIVPIYSLLYQSRQAVAEGRYQSIARIAAEAQVERFRDIAQRSEADFAALAGHLSVNANARFRVVGLPGWVGAAAAENAGCNGRIRVCLNETQQFWTNVVGPTHDDYFSCAGFTQVPFPAFQLDLDNSLKATGTAANNVPTTGNYRILPIRVEVFWGFRTISGTDARDMAPKVVLNAVLSPKFHFRRG